MEVAVKLPVEIIREHIFPFLYNCQPKTLCEDIRSFVDCRDYLFALYLQRYRDFGIINNDWLQWLDIDIRRFMIQDDRLFSERSNRRKRLQILKKNKYATLFLWNSQPNYDCLKYIYVNLGAMNPIEREDLLVFTEVILYELID